MVISFVAVLILWSKLNPELVLLYVWSFTCSCYVHIHFLQVLRVLLTSNKKHAGLLIAPSYEAVCECVCVRWPAMGWRHIKDELLPYTHCSCDTLWIHHDSEKQLLKMNQYSSFHPLVINIWTDFVYFSAMSHPFKKLYFCSNCR